MTDTVKGRMQIVIHIFWVQLESKHGFSSGRGGWVTPEVKSGSSAFLLFLLNLNIRTVNRVADCRGDFASRGFATEIWSVKPRSCDAFDGLH